MIHRAFVPHQTANSLRRPSNPPPHPSLLPPTRRGSDPSGASKHLSLISAPQRTLRPGGRDKGRNYETRTRHSFQFMRAVAVFCFNKERIEGPPPSDPPTSPTPDTHRQAQRMSCKFSLRPTDQQTQVWQTLAFCFVLFFWGGCYFSERMKHSYLSAARRRVTQQVPSVVFRSDLPRPRMYGLPSM